MGISRVFDIAGRSLSVYQRALDATSHNISNANNTNFTRTKVVLGTERADPIAGGEWGTGVKLENIQRIRMNLIDVQNRSYQSRFSYSEKKSSILSQVESLLSEPSDQGLSKLLSNFYGSWDKLASSPNSIPLRANVIQAGQSVVAKIQNVYEGFSQAKIDLKSELDEQVTQLNNNLSTIQSLNRQIFEAKSSNQSVNDLMDQRDKAIDELSKLANITMNYDDQGNANISIGGVFAADGFVHTEFKTDIINGKVAIVTKDGAGRAALDGGELFGITDLYNTVISGYQGKIDQVATNLMNSVNQIHSTGYDLNGNTGVNFFSGYADGVLSINTLIAGNPGTNTASDPSRIAVAKVNQNGNGDLAIQLAQLANKKLINGQSVGEFYSTFISGVGSDKEMADQSATSNQLVLDQLAVQKASFSGVSIDEEMTNMIRFQRSYDASAKVIKIADEMLQTLINMV